ncbi:MAG TPA: c-type cytochrome, partial [Schlesneria sp.]
LILRDSGQLPELALNNGASIELPLRFTSGIHRGRMNTHDGQLYVTGLKGWTTSAVHDGCFQRVRYTGKPLRMPIGLETYQNGVALRFSCALDRNAAQDLANYQLEAWDYKWSAAYGSPEFKPSAPGQTGRDEVQVRSVTLLDKQTVFFELSNLKPVDQLAISYTILSADNHELDQSAILTLNSISKDLFPERELYRQPEDLERAKLLASLVPGIDVVERLAERGAETQALNIRDVQRMITWDRPALRGNSSLRTIDAQGWIKIPRTGRYRFYGEDPARPPLDRKGPRAKPARTGSARVVNPYSTFLRIGSSSAVEVPVDGLELSLSRGVHPFSIEYFAKTDSDVHYRLLWESNRFPREAIPAGALFREPATDPAPSQRQSGAILFEKLRCANCHESPVPHETPKYQPGSDQAFVKIFRSTPRLDEIGARLQPTWIAHWLRQPRRLRSISTMPALLDPNDHATANDIAAYLSTLGKMTSVNVPPALTQAEAETVFRTGAELYEQLGCIACHSTADDNQPDNWHRVSLHYVNSKFQRHSLIEYLRDPHRHHPNSPMPNFRLTETEVQAFAEYLRREAHGQLEAPEGEHGNAERGRLAFAKHRCANCHSIETAGKLAKSNVPAIEWKGEEKSGAMGCLELTLKDSPKSPHFKLTETDRGALGQFLRSRADAKLVVGSMRSVDLWLGELRCQACHSRDSRQSSWPEIIAEEGSGKAAESIPQLTWVGEKLQGPWIEKLLQGKIKQKPRPWVKARMPAFPAYANLIAHGMAAEHGVFFDEPIPSKSNPSRVDLGRRLTMREGLDCRQCHGVGSEQPRGDASTQIALGINFAMTRDRLRPEFALRQMLDPSRYDVGSRMPRFASDLKTTAATQIEGGDARKQFELLKEFIWSVKDK